MVQPAETWWTENSRTTSIVVLRDLVIGERNSVSFGSPFHVDSDVHPDLFLSGLTVVILFCFSLRAI